MTKNIWQSLNFWTLVAALIVFIIKFFVPSFPFDEALILKFFLFVLGVVNIHPELKARGLR